MKRFLTTLTAVLLAVLLCCSAAFAAAPASYYLEEMDADIGLPSWDDYYFLYPDMPADNEDLYALELTPQDINDILVPNGILFDALYYDATHEIAVTVTEDRLGNALFNFNLLSEGEREAAASSVVAEFEGMGVAIQTMEWVDGGSAAWMVLEYTLPNNGGWAYQYTTVYNGKTLSFVASSAYGVELTGQIRDTVAGMALGTVFHHTDPAPEGSGIAGGMLGNVDLGSVDVEAMADALGLTMEEMMALTQGELELSSLDLGEVDLEGLVNALGMTEAELFELIRQESGLAALDLSAVDLGEIDLEALVAALDLTEAEAFALLEGELDPSELDLSGMDIPALLDAVGLTAGEVAMILLPLLLESAGVGGMDWKGLLLSVGKGALIGLGAGVVVVILIIVLLAVTGRKKRAKISTEE